MKFLVVEDEMMVAEMLRRALEELGNQCLVAPCASRADELIDEHQIDAVTLDLGMPERNGLEWLEEIAVSRPELARRTLVITGMPLGAEAVERLARCGAGVLAKPFTFESLQDAVRTQIARPDYPGQD